MSVLSSSAVFGFIPRAPDSPYGDVLGWLIVFFMIVWPLLRSAVSAANERRRKFIEEEQRRERTRGRLDRRLRGDVSSGPQPVTDPLEALRRALLGRVEVDEDSGLYGGGTTADPSRAPRRPPARTAQSAPAGTTRVPAARPDAEPGAAFERARAEARERSAMGGDPFDERTMERPLVADPELARVPSEGGRATEPPRRHTHGGTPSTARAALNGADATEAPPLRRRGAAGGAPSGAPSGVTQVPPGARTLARIMQRTRSPWGQAILHHELLGPPAALREPRY
ncbi:MAG: hypothetical protein R3F49_01735 [Planctomycetota bacterium]